MICPVLNATRRPCDHAPQMITGTAEDIHRLERSAGHAEDIFRDKYGRRIVCAPYLGWAGGCAFIDVGTSA
jgi:hypothetical protein